MPQSFRYASALSLAYSRIQLRCTRIFYRSIHLILLSVPPMLCMDLIRIMWLFMKNGQRKPPTANILNQSLKIQKVTMISTYTDTSTMLSATVRTATVSIHMRPMPISLMRFCVNSFPWEKGSKSTRQDSNTGWDIQTRPKLFFYAITNSGERF